MDVDDDMILFVWQPIGWISLQSCRVMQIQKDVWH